ncbi:hypothetical protein ACFSC1_13940 [Paracoccus aurantiacus]|uniref:hypothetical protein n=1 Tax=Paracoccus aurantiacus TaxID=2599412 RepID=UPI00164B56D3|nr:hypothetical protein [Paracoccus aurantiacus]
MRFVFALLILLIPLPALAATEEPAALCEWAAQTAATEAGVPPDILGALTLTETGRRRDGIVRPWAWSVNAEGEGTWFDDPNSAIAFAEERVAQGRTNVDIGCFQLNYRWHGENFGSVADMFDPLSNARYAARFVSQLHAEMGDWRRAAGAFHSRTQANATRYLARFDELRAGLRAGGFDGMRDMSETYNRFASADPGAVARLPQPSRQARIVEKRMLLGAPIGTATTGMPGSLAVIGGERVALLSAGALRDADTTERRLLGQRSQPLIGPGAAPMRTRDRRTERRSRGSTRKARQADPDMEAEELAATPEIPPEYAAAIPDGGAAPQDLMIPVTEMPL